MPSCLEFASFFVPFSTEGDFSLILLILEEDFLFRELMDNDSVLLFSVAELVLRLLLLRLTTLSLKSSSMELSPLVGDLADFKSSIVKKSDPLLIEELDSSIDRDSAVLTLPLCGTRPPTLAPRALRVVLIGRLGIPPMSVEVNSV